jgi:hypothetical protein
MNFKTADIADSYLQVEGYKQGHLKTQATRAYQTPERAIQEPHQDIIQRNWKPK